MKKNHSFTATLVVTAIASSLILSSLGTAEACIYTQSPESPQATNPIFPSSLVSKNQPNIDGNQWSLWGMGVAIAAGLVGTGMALKHRAKGHQADVVVETATPTPEFPELSSFAIVVPPEALISAQKANADLTYVG